jgi:hypothetical protein
MSTCRWVFRSIICATTRMRSRLSASSPRTPATRTRMALIGALSWPLGKAFLFVNAEIERRSVSSNGGVCR